MIDTDAFVKNSPFKVTHNDTSSNYNLTNTTSDLLKFQLQEQYRTKLSELKKPPTTDTLALLLVLSTVAGSLFEDSFNAHLQSGLDSGNITFDLGDLSGDDDDLDSFIHQSSNKPNYLNLKVLIENSILDTNKISKDSILSLAAVKLLKQHISDTEDLQDYLLSKMAISQQFIATVMDHSQQELDAPLLLKILKLNTLLQDQIVGNWTQLDQMNTKLNNHNLACLVLGYVEDVKLSSTKNAAYNAISSPSPSPQRLVSSPRKATSDANKSFNTLFSHIAHIAAQRNITLPTPPSPSTDDTDSRTKWAQSCIDAVLAANSSRLQTPDTEESFDTKDTLLNDSFASSPMRGKTDADRVLAEYKTALNDLRFSHQYLSKEYEHSRDSSIKIIQEYRKKIAHLEKEVSKSISASSSYNNLTLDDHDTIASKDKEITKLRRELNALKIDKLGLKNGLSSQVISPNVGSFDSIQMTGAFSQVTLSPPPPSGDLLGFSGNRSSQGEDDDDAALIISGIPKSNNGTSNGILRKEFKKIVKDIQDQYEVELGEERIRRRKLQAELDALKTKV